MKTAEEYIKSIKKMKANVYQFGKLIEDVTTHGTTKYTIKGIAELYRLALAPEYEEIMTTASILTGEKINRYLSIMQTKEDAIRNTYIKRLAFQRTSSCTGARCAGWSCINSMWATTFDMDKELGTNYHERFKKWLLFAQKNDIAIAGALTDSKGNRTLPPSKQEDKDMSLHIVDENDEGIVVRGAKVMISGACAANELFILPGSGYREDDKDYAIAFVIPRDTEGLTIIENRRAGDKRKLEEGFDKGCEAGGITEGWLFFDDVFVPKERVFMCKEFRYSGPAVYRFVLCERATMGGCVAGQGDVKIAAAVCMAHCNGLGTKPLINKFIEMAIDNETLYGVGVAACALGKKHPSGVFIPDPLLSNVSKVHVSTIPYDTSVLCQEIAGGIGEVGCIPSYADFMDKKLGPLVKKYLKAASPAEARMRTARLIEYTTIGVGVPGCMHGGGSPDAAKLPMRRLLDLDGFYLEMGKRLAGIEDDIKIDIAKKNKK